MANTECLPMFKVKEYYYSYILKTKGLNIFISLILELHINISCCQHIDSYTNCKETHSKLDPTHYEKFDAKSNFKKLFKNNLNCRFGCLVTEDQNHIFKSCQVLNFLWKQKTKREYEGIFSDITF